MGHPWSVPPFLCCSVPSKQARYRLTSTKSINRFITVFRFPQVTLFVRVLFLRIPHSIQRYRADLVNIRVNWTRLIASRATRRLYWILNKLSPSLTVVKGIRRRKRKKRKRVKDSEEILVDEAQKEPSVEGKELMADMKKKQRSKKRISHRSQRSQRT
ncbi:hypothetical protein BC829DRAFT_259386 [Chytridium lagenaria]|nr:hypothetical protein BC829DRAFT_259386 [Chytridium lagenaria]